MTKTTIAALALLPILSAPAAYSTDLIAAGSIHQRNVTFRNVTFAIGFGRRFRNTSPTA